MVRRSSEDEEAPRRDATRGTVVGAAVRSPLAARCSPLLPPNSRPPFAPTPTPQKLNKKQSTPLVLGFGVAAAALVGRAAVQQYVKFAARPAAARAFYKGGFKAEMDRREASLILGLRESAGEEKVKEAHRRIMVANHPDSGGSSFLAAKVNEAKDVMLGKRKKGGSVF